ncbi:hypothetical protein HMPREF9371_1611 [Neisseria shayeganii 871]|uniref:Uncharacterized protein n=1 Tax=Neisseria shayeganii 871 TaxID=1032488 RepID=G4CJ22_9NEIS|nr:hypothetical protein HMPREF9371_1611 [Neisseria shayeganii 871]
MGGCKRLHRRRLARRLSGSLIRRLCVRIHPFPSYGRPLA